MKVSFQNGPVIRIWWALMTRMIRLLQDSIRQDIPSSTLWTYQVQAECSCLLGNAVVIDQVRIPIYTESFTSLVIYSPFTLNTFALFLFRYFKRKISFLFFWRFSSNNFLWSSFTCISIFRSYFRIMASISINSALRFPLNFKPFFWQRTWRSLSLLG